MKKSLLLISLLLIATSLVVAFKPKTKNAHLTVLSRPPIVYKTLNGIDSASAVQMIATFARYYEKDISDKSISTWYSKDQIRDIYKILNDEESKGADGIRIYFGCDPPSPGSTELKTSILLVSTKGRTISPPDETKSDHGDYYAHETSALGRPTGDAIDNDADNVYNQGALLYGSVMPGQDTCEEPSKHYINIPLAYNWVQQRREGNGKNDKSPLNTKSEWFPMCFIKGILGTIVNGNNGSVFSGLRIYLGKGFKDEKNKIRDVFVLVPTTSTSIGDADFYRCLEDISKTPFCSVPQEFYHSNSKNMLYAMLAVYDNGELCPTHCP